LKAYLMHGASNVSELLDGLHVTSIVLIRLLSATYEHVSEAFDAKGAGAIIYRPGHQ